MMVYCILATDNFRCIHLTLAGSCPLEPRSQQTDETVLFPAAKGPWALCRFLPTTY